MIIIESIRTDITGRGFVTFTRPLIGSPSPDTDTGYEKSLAFNTNTPAGRAILSVLLTAQAGGFLVYAKGTGNCTIYSGVIEDWNWGKITD